MELDQHAESVIHIVKRTLDGVAVAEVQATFVGCLVAVTIG
jgi:hypothetical protein